MVKRAARSNAPSINPRVHVVLIPGFPGFDALGQMVYYAGVTPQYRRWKHAGGTARDHVVLHYFDNFPTAAVVTRATRLRDYLAKRVARGEFLPGDSIALIGHSTGGLDIRRLICDLVADKDADTRYSVDGTHGSPFTVCAADLLDMVKRIVFLSVPQFGTNIADWVRTYTLGRQVVLAKLRASVAASQVPVLDRLEECVSAFAATATNLDLLEAAKDALAEAESWCVADRMRTLMAQEAASELALWLRHIASDFSAIDDLSVDADGDTISPAHFTAKMREDETAAWKNHGILAQSYATLGARPFDFDPDRPAPRWDLVNPLSYPETTRRSRPSVKCDIAYRTCYRACAGGPFRYPNIPRLPAPPKLVDESGRQRTIAIWDNDGIVNTASMLWPNGRQTVLFNADHMDIVGHFRRVRAVGRDTGRTYQAYDLLKSGTGFHLNKFEQVWNGIFTFCASQPTNPGRSKP